MSLLKVVPSRLRGLAGDCEMWSAGVALAGVPAFPAASVQASVAAVGGIHASTGLAARAMSTRMGVTGTHLNTAATGYTAEDTGAASVLSRLGRVS